MLAVLELNTMRVQILLISSYRNIKSTNESNIFYTLQGIYDSGDLRLVETYL